MRLTEGLKDLKDLKELKELKRAFRTLQPDFDGLCRILKPRRWAQISCISQVFHWCAAFNWLYHAKA